MRCLYFSDCFVISAEEMHCGSGVGNQYRHHHLLLAFLMACIGLEISERLWGQFSWTGSLTWKMSSHLSFCYFRRTAVNARKNCVALRKWHGRSIHAAVFTTLEFCNWLLPSFCVVDVSLPSELCVPGTCNVNMPHCLPYTLHSQNGT